MSNVIAIVGCFVLATLVAVARVAKGNKKRQNRPFKKMSKRLKGIRMARCCKHCAHHGVYNTCPCQITATKPTDKYMICDDYVKRIYNTGRQRPRGSAKPLEAKDGATKQRAPKTPTLTPTVKRT